MKLVESIKIFIELHLSNKILVKNVKHLRKKISEFIKKYVSLHQLDMHQIDCTKSIMHQVYMHHGTKSIAPIPLHQVVILRWQNTSVTNMIIQNFKLKFKPSKTLYSATTKHRFELSEQLDLPEKNSMFRAISATQIHFHAPRNIKSWTSLSAQKQTKMRVQNGIEGRRGTDA